MDAGALIMSAKTARVLLAAFVRISQMSPMMAERPDLSFADELQELPTTDQDDGGAPEEEQSTGVEVTNITDAAHGTADASALPQAGSPGGSATCASFFGSLDEMMTIVDLDLAGGCVQGMNPQNAVIRFAGGADSTCQPPVQGNGCHRYIVSRYSDDCNMSPLKEKLGQEVSLTSTKDTGLFGQDGVYKMCNQAGLLQSRTLFYFGDSRDPENSCNENTCGCNDDHAAIACVGHGNEGAASVIEESAATRVSSFWVGYLSAAVTATCIL